MAADLDCVNKARSVNSESLSDDSSTLGTALYFCSGTEQLFGWLHRPVKNHASLGLVICKPFGHEAICAHRGIRTMAETAARIGIPTLRFDYLGTGDSADIEDDADQIDRWTKNVLAAIVEIKRLTGVAHVCLIGVRLGGLLAVLAADLCESVVSQILIAPVLDGPRYTRELRARMLAGELHTPPPAFRSPGPSTQSGGLEVNGFALSRATISALSDSQIATKPWPSRVTSLIIDGPALPSSQEWFTLKRGTGARIEYANLPGLADMILQSSLNAEVPKALITTVREWLSKVLKELDTRPIKNNFLAYVTERRVNHQMILKSGAVERPVFISANKSMLFGITTEYHESAGSRQGVIFLNTGADNHIGANRLHVYLARHWAPQGDVVLRLDLGGLGDSETGEGCLDDEVFPRDALNEVLAAIDFLRDGYGVDNIIVGGICAGAYHALQAAIAGAPINKVFLINPQNYFWEPGAQIDDLHHADVLRSSSLYINRARLPQTWQMLLRLQVSPFKIARVIIARGILAIDSLLREIARRAGMNFSNDLGRQLKQVTDLGIQLVFIFAKGEPGIRLLQLQAGSILKRLGQRCRIRVIQGGDHTFTQRHWREIMVKILDEEILHPPGRSQV